MKYFSGIIVGFIAGLLFAAMPELIIQWVKDGIAFSIFPFFTYAYFKWVPDSWLG